MIKLPHLTWNLDCEALGYPGLVFVLWLNPPAQAEPEAPSTKAPWGHPLYGMLARIIDGVCVPAEYSDTGRAEEIEIGGDGKALYELEQAAGFDPQLLIWVSRQYREQRSRRLDTELKN